jgi:hypothetical protein
MRLICYLLLALLTTLITSAWSHADTLWAENLTESKNGQIKISRATARHGRILQIDPIELSQKFLNLDQPVEITLPLPDGGMLSIRLTPSQILSETLALKYPKMMSYQAQEIGRPENIGRFSISHLGLFGFFRFNNQWLLLSPKYQGHSEEYFSYWYKDGLVEATQASKTKDFLLTSLPIETPQLSAKLINTGDEVRTFRLAISTTGEYTQRLGGTADNVVAEIMNLVNRINQILLIDLALQFELVDNQDIIFFDADTDPFTNAVAATDIVTNQRIVDAAIGSENYDVGHLLGTNGGGLAFVRGACDTSLKAQGYSGASNPQGERFYINFVAHELGHQLGATHSFNATNSGSCDTGQRDNNTAYEPGSGSTIMAYAGFCGSQDIQNDSDPYFHAISIEDIHDHVESFSVQNCGTRSDLGNNIPQIQLEGNSYTIPANTPFLLSASGSDADNDPLTYTWEQFDNGGTEGATSSRAELNSDNRNNPLFRSFPPVDIAQRYFPQLSDVLDAQTSIGETYATTDREMQFRLTVRDNKGGVNQQTLSIDVVSSTQPFSLDDPSNWQGLSERQITWDRGNTHEPPINCLSVDILLDNQGNGEFETALVTGTTNDGSYDLIVPNIDTDNARLMLRCNENIFYVVNTQNFSILSTGPIGPSIDGQMSITLAEDSSVNIDFSDIVVSDADSNYPEDFTLIIQSGDNYTLNLQNLTVASNFNGLLNVPVVINDGELDSNVFVLSIEVIAVNDAPIAFDDTFSVPQNSTTRVLDVLQNDTDVDGDTLSIDSFRYSGAGQLTLLDGQLNYSPSAGFSGRETIEYDSTDGQLTDQASVKINVVVATDRTTGSGSGSVYVLLFYALFIFFVKQVSSTHHRPEYK